MKKQLLLIVIAIFASLVTLAQNTPFDPPSCAGDALHPSVGQQYQYQVTVPTGYTGYNGDGAFQWWVTQDVNLLTGIISPNGTDFLATGTGTFTYNTLQAGETTLSVVWNGSSIGTGNYYLIVRYKETNENATISCDPDNVKVYMITPQNTFWLRIENVADAAGVAGGAEHCAPLVAGAKIVLTTGVGEVEYQYGSLVHYIKVSANGYTGNFDAKLRLPALPEGMGYGNSAYTVPDAITYTSTSGNGTIAYTSLADTIGGVDLGVVWHATNTYDPGDPNATPPVDPSWGTGEEIIISIPIHYNHNETLIDHDLIFAVDGSFTVGPVGSTTTYNDLSNVNGPCSEEAAFDDDTTTTLRARPGLNAVTPPAFVPSGTTVTP